MFSREPFAILAWLPPAAALRDSASNRHIGAPCHEPIWLSWHYGFRKSKVRDMIQDVQVKPLKHIPDERGFLMEMLRADDALFEKFGQAYITGCKRGVAKAWHYHREQTDHFVCVYGTALVVLHDIREGSPTRGETQEFVLQAPPCVEHEPILLKIPPMVVHGFTAIGCDEARIINIPSLPYRYASPDEYRYPWNSPDVPYRWPAHVTRGG